MVSYIKKYKLKLYRFKEGLWLNIQWKTMLQRLDKQQEKE